ncbi:MAG: DNA starvation/stationary phase protection protein [Crocinitomicaceae bacterium]|jgi:starvation-inducible DNA-binding protein|nr:DNA starvation/stationary phase protection protein [Crocinitomicaceae bacterium]MDP4867171.1 DNA starvation/stationary phase protection protein [Crocinitomicaceae bacterium]MDP5011495.1 DNA starvation/stationary phase protection protein [Crocinitomicaceae bacterium]
MKKNTTYTEKLNVLLASYELHYQNLRSLHWNIKGTNFFELHLKYEELYTRTQVIIDDIAERILTLGVVPLSTFTDYIKHSKIAENAIITDGKKGMEYILSAQKSILKLEKELLTLSAEKEDEGTNSFISDLVREKEKTNWMFSSWLNQ